MAVARVQPKQKGPSRLIIYTLVGAVAIYAYVLQTTPDKAAKHTKTHRTTHKTASTVDEGITDADLTAHFDRYKATGKAPFVPAIALRPDQGGVLATGGGGQWSLTGVNTVDGVTTATVENPASNDSAFLRVGDSWNGLRVTAITQESVSFTNALGQPTTLSFPGNDLGDNGQPAKPGENPAPSTGGGNIAAAPPLPSLSVRPMQIAGPPAPPGGGGDQGGGGNNPGDQNNQ